MNFIEFEGNLINVDMVCYVSKIYKDIESPVKQEAHNFSIFFSGGECLFIYEEIGSDLVRKRGKLISLINQLRESK